MSKSIILTGGGTAGHVTPNLALIEPLRAAGFEVGYMGQPKEMERGLAEGAGLPYYFVRAGRFHRYLTKDFWDPLLNIKGFFMANKTFKKIKPDIVFAKGGFVSIPVVTAARWRRIPVVLHESDFTPGLANKICAPFATKVCTNFKETVDHFKPGKAVCTGTPIRKELSEGSREAGLELTGFSPELPVILVMGGSLGAGALNDAVRAALPLFEGKLQLVHLCGRGNVDESLVGRPGYLQLEYAGPELKDLYAMADAMLSRAGANALAEILLLAIPALLVPLPASSGSRGDQELNAESFRKNGYSAVLPQDEITPERLLSELEALLAGREDYVRAMKASEAKNGTEAVMRVILEVAKGKENRK